ncbi:MAG: ATP-binding protein [Muribaculaceae bacterium]|nr:ATP-binding protein [Muribaculaceae bacterium]
MKYKTLHVKNFGPIKDAKIELKPVNLFIGEQSIGKSTLAKLITIFTDHVSLCEIVSGSNPLWEYQLKEYNLDIYKDDPYYIAFDMHEDDQAFHIQVEAGNISFYLIDGNQKITDKDKITTKIITLKKIFHEDKFAEELRKKAAAGIPNEDLLNLFSNSLYIPAERIICSVLTNLMPALYLAKSSIPKNLVRFLMELNNAKSEYPKLPIDLLNISFNYEDNKDFIILDSTQQPIPMTAASSGIQSLVPLLLVLRYVIDKREYASFVVEEPECNLFPTKQVELLRQIIGMIKNPNHILTITTHSPYLLSAMNNILFAGDLYKSGGEELRKYIDTIIPNGSLLDASECSVYSLGEEINEGIYCKSLIDPETGMIDFNSLDGVSEELGEEFDELQRAAIKFKS